MKTTQKIKNQHLSDYINSRKFEPKSYPVILNKTSFVVSGFDTDEEDTARNISFYLVPTELGEVWVNTEEANKIIERVGDIENIVSYEFVSGLTTPYGSNKSLMAEYADGYEVTLVYATYPF